MSAPLSWWAISAGTENGMEGERDARIRATTAERAQELYLTTRPSTWVIVSCEPSEAPVVRDPVAIALKTAEAQEERIAARERRQAVVANRKKRRGKR